MPCGLVAVSSICLSYLIPNRVFINQVIEQENRNGSIGGEVLRRFTTTFDYKNKMLVLRPRMATLTMGSTTNMSGLEI
jgi:hypothetical protein